MGELCMRVEQSTAKFQSPFLVLFFLNLQISARFAIRSEQDIAELIEDKDSKSTKTSTKLATELLKQVCTVTGFFLLNIHGVPVI